MPTLWEIPVGDDVALTDDQIRAGDVLVVHEGEFTAFAGTPEACTFRLSPRIYDNTPPGSRVFERIA